MSKYNLRKVLRVLAWGGTALVAMLAASIVSSLTIDLGPALREKAETYGSKRISRRMHIGKLSVKLGLGRFVVEDFVIEGLKRSDRPFFTAKMVELSMPLSALINKQVLFDSVQLTDWRMLVEKWPDLHNFPKFTSDAPNTGPKRFTTTLRYFKGTRGQFTYEDHETPWSIVAPNLELSIGNFPGYHGEATFAGGTVKIQDYLPMSADMRCWFKIIGGKVHLDRVDMRTDGAQTRATGDVDLAHWPEQVYQVHSKVHFPRMREIFFASEHFSLFGDGDFDGTFHLYKRGRELKGDFSSAVAGVNAFRFPKLRGSLLWLPDRFEVDDASSSFYGGQARFSYSMRPLGAPVKPTARLDATYRDVNLVAFSDFLEMRGIRLSGQASGENLLEWPLGRFREHRGNGRVSVQPAGEAVMTPALASDMARAEERAGRPWGPFTAPPLPGYVPIGGEVSYEFGPEWIEVGASHLASPKTYVEFQGATAYGTHSRFPFHVVSADWQESDQLLAGILTAFGSESGTIQVGGRGTFDGVMLGAFEDPRIEGDFTFADVRAWDVVWGSGHGRAAIQHKYVEVTDSTVTLGGSQIQAVGRFSLGYPRKDRGEEIDARVHMVKRDLAGLKHAFQLDEYPVSGKVSGDFHLYGQYERPFGFGSLAIEEGVAYREPFQAANASMRFEGQGVRLEGIDIRKSTGTITGAAFIGWDGTYSFNADGRRIPMESIAATAFPRAPLSGLLEFTAGGSGTFETPRYDARLRITDLFISDEGVGQITGRLGLRGTLMNLEFEAASPRLAVSGTGRIALTPAYDAELSFRFTDTSLDPYVRAFQPKLSPYTTAVASGAIRVVGELADVDHLLVDGTVERLDLRMFDYKVRNADPIRLALDQHTVRVQQMHVVGEDTELGVSGTINLHDRRINLVSAGRANLGILQGFVAEIRSAGRAELKAEITGALNDPVFSGSATITDGRIRHFSLPHSLEEINGKLSFDAHGIRLEDIAARLGGGRVRFGGRLGLEGYLPGELNVTAIGEDMQLRYPEGVPPVTTADLIWRGNTRMPPLGGRGRVKNGVWPRRFETAPGLLDLTARGTTLASVPAAESSLPLRFDVRVVAPSTLRIENNAARIVSSADLTLRGTYDRPVLFGRAEVERGEVLFEGRRYFVTRGTIDFTNPNRIEPFFDVEAETRVRVPGQTYRVTLTAAGTPQRLNGSLSSDPPLPQVEILSLLLSDVHSTQDAELRSLSRPNVAEQSLITSRAAQFLASPISSEVGRVVEQTFGVDTFQLTPTLGDPYATRINPAARLTIGKRISDRAYLTYSRSLASTNRDQIILLEYDQSDRLSWILSQNEDRTYALDVRVRHAF